MSPTRPRPPAPYGLAMRKHLRPNEDGPRILVVHGQPAVRRFLRASLCPKGYRVFARGTAEQGLAALRAVRPDAIILDLGLPDMNGVEVTRQIREWSDVPIVILSGGNRDADEIAALDAGADDCLARPFSSGELLARVRLALRHASGPFGGPVVTVGDLTVDLAHHLVTVAGRGVSLTRIEYDLLKALAMRAGRVLTHRQLLLQVWGPEYDRDLNLLRVTMSKLRHKTEPDPAQPRYIVTENGVGYRLRAAT